MSGMKHGISSKEERYDIILVADYFRSANAFLSILVGLSKEYKIGLYLTPLAENLRQKNDVAQREFIAMAESLGAELLHLEGGVAQSDVMLVLQRAYSEEDVRAVKTKVRAKRVIGLLGLATAGLPLHDAFVRQFDIRKAYVPCMRLFRFLTGRRNAEPIYANIAIEQVGLPYKDYPFVTSTPVDWLIAAPTSFSFRSEKNKHAFLANVLRLLTRIPPNEVVAYKPHNGHEKDYFVSGKLAMLASLIGDVPGVERLVRFAAHYSLPIAGSFFDRLLTALLHRQVMKIAVPLSSLSRYEWISLEAFLPNVRKGIIGGLSNTIWGTLYFGLPFFNCVDMEQRQVTALDRARGFKDGEALLDLNMQFFGVPSCDGDITRPALPKSIVADEDLEGDLVVSLRSDLTGKASRVPRSVSPSSEAVVRVK